MALKDYPCIVPVYALTAWQTLAYFILDIKKLWPSNICTEIGSGLNDTELVT